jgi:protease IV
VIKSDKKALLGVLILVLIFFVLLMIFAAFTMRVFNESASSGNEIPSSGSIGVVEVSGVIMESKTTVELLHRAEKDKRIKAIVLRINSPGGAVGPTQEIYDEIRRIDSQYEPGKKGKPVYASFGTVAASGGYYIGAAAREIYAPAGALTGSIGVIMQFFDMSELFHLAKVEQVTIKAGRYKDIGHPNRKMTKEEKDLMNKVISGVHQQFIDDILSQRKKKLKKDINELAQGQIFSGMDAQKLGLVDKLGSLWKLGRDIHKELKLKGELNLHYVIKKKRLSVWDMLENIDEAVTNLNLKALGSKVPMFLMN